MKYILLGLLSFNFLFGYNYVVAQEENPPASDAFYFYLQEHRIEPIAVDSSSINIEDTPKTIIIGKHKIIVFYDSVVSETFLKIDDDLFSLNDQTTLNDVWEEEKDPLDNLGAIDSLRIFNYRGKEIITMMLPLASCNGMGCMANYYLVYDVATKTKNSFGTFRGDYNGVQLYDFKNDDRLDYISKTYYGEPYGIGTDVIELYSRNDDGKFVLRKDKKGIPYQVKMTGNAFDEDNKEEFEQHWISTIK